MDELASRLTIQEAEEWAECFLMEQEAHQKAQQAAKAKRRR